MHDITQAPQLLSGLHGANVIADKGYDAGALVAAIEARRIAMRFEKLAAHFLGMVLLAAVLLWAL